MFTIIGIMLAGVVVGYLLRKQENLKHVNQAITVIIWLLLFLLGVEVGGNERIINGLHNLGYEAIVLATGGLFGSVLLAWALWQFLNRRKKGASK